MGRSKLETIKTYVLHVRLEDNMRIKLEQMCDKKHVSKSDIARAGIRAMVEEKRGRDDG